MAVAVGVALPWLHVLDLAGMVGVGSALVVALVAVLLLVLLPRFQPSGFFALFLLTLAVQMLTSALSRAARLAGDAAAAQSFFDARLAALFFVHLPLILFAHSFPSRHGALAPGRPASLALPFVAGASLLVLLMAPRWVYYPHPSGGPPVWGPVALLHFALFLLAFAYSLAVLHAYQDRAPARIGVRRTVLAMLALLLFVSYVSAEKLVYYGQAALAGTLEPARVPEALVMVMASAAALAVVAYVGASILTRPRLGARQPRAYVLPALLLPSVAGALTGFAGLPTMWVMPVDGTGIWPALASVLVASTLLAYEREDLLPLAKRALVAAGLVGGPTVLALVAARLFAPLGGAGLGMASLVALTAAIGVVTSAIVVRGRLVQRVSRRILLAGERPEALDDRRLDVYEATLARSHMEGSLEAEQGFLRELRRRLGITDREHALLLRLVENPSGSDDDTQRLRPGARIADRYLLQSLLGEGAEGAAYVTTDERLGRDVVVKTLVAYPMMTQDAHHRFLREARITAEMNHPNVIRVYDFGYHGDRPFLVMEFAEGGSLADRFAREGRLDPERAVAIMDDVLQGLAHIHMHRILHRDLKPANILFASEGHAMVSDFGIAHHLEASARGGLGDAEAPGGTPAFMSPEAVKGVSLRPESDIYAVGALFYWMLTGHTYLDFAGRTAADIRHAILHEAPEALDGVPPDLAAVVLQALHKDPAQRFPDAEGMRRAMHGDPAPRVLRQGVARLA